MKSLENVNTGNIFNAVMT